MPRYVDIECDAVTEVIGRRAFRSRQDIQEFLDNIPTVDLAPVRHGHWIHKDNPNTDIYEHRPLSICSECGHTILGDPPYCAECGAKMDAKELNND